MNYIFIFMFIYINNIYAASEATYHEPKIQHYQAQMPLSLKGAIEQIETRNQNIKSILVKKILTDTSLEEIHECSYWLENAIDYLRKTIKTEDTTLDDLDESIQGLHYSAENHLEAETRIWAKKLDLSFEKFKKFYKQ